MSKKFRITFQCLGLLFHSDLFLVITVMPLAYVQKDKVVATAACAEAAAEEVVRFVGSIVEARAGDRRLVEAAPRIPPATLENMIIPVRCFTCGKVIGNKYDAYIRLLKMEDKTEGEALDALALKRYCCRRMLLTHVDLIEKLLQYDNFERSARESR
ncbi:DNA-directed RNA polymerases I, II, and III subunit RPABC5 [Porphyridium purpureum]|uniref:DNA-directed RNA polymerases I, II, and III subunit RPABC5 n=1 Tax=Porphyridium purpureum TaxID=35688 RepID=A0A5J4Z621_PORPP|nr:DNA-directed RNA polymerases I, II, and III subunit RPABC5 [Porphyridium purpureum]|eukprot:POR3013..scf295_1